MQNNISKFYYSHQSGGILFVKKNNSLVVVQKQMLDVDSWSAVTDDVGCYEQLSDGRHHRSSGRLDEKFTKKEINFHKQMCSKSCLKAGKVHHCIE